MNSTRYVAPSRRAAAMVIAAIAFSAVTGAAIVTWLSADQTTLMSECDPIISAPRHARGPSRWMGELCDANRLAGLTLLAGARHIGD